jgi:gamma-glutamyltranspeptidase/glutathione hydrolase
MRPFLLPSALLLFLMSTSYSQTREWPRSPALAPHGMVATGHPLAVEIGVEILKQGGNAVDAAIATNAALGLMEPMSCGMGGDLYALVWDAKTQKLYGLNASGRAPYAATIEFFKKQGMKDIPGSGKFSWSVPGCVDGWAVLQERFGKLKLKDVLEPAIRYAEAGVPVPPVIAGYWRGAQTLAQRSEDLGRTYLMNGRSPRTGEVFKNPRLANSYRLVAEGGRDAFYKGPIASQIVAYSKKVGGLFDQKDFDDHTSTWVEPVTTNYRGYTVAAIPPPGQGIAALQMLNLLEPYDLKKMGAGSADYWHLFLEAKKLAYADRARFYTDPEFAKVPVAELISKKYAEQRRKLISLNKALTQVDHGDPKLGQSDTVYLTVVDNERNCVSLIQSNYNGFGSGLVPGELGFALQNRGTLFALDENHPNRLEPHKRPFHTIIPGFVLKDGKPYFCFGCMGGDMQPQGQVEILCNLLDFGMNVQAAGAYPRLEHTGSATPKGRSMDANGGTVQAEPGIPEAVIAELEKRGHQVRRVARNGGGYQGILIHPETGMLLGGSEPRKDGAAWGY